MTDDPVIFKTDRIRAIRADSPTANDESTLSLIERFGCEVLTVKASAVSPSWTYTTGIFDTIGQPELITIGLPQKTALSAMNSAFKAFREGIDLQHGRHRELVGEVECEFKPVDPAWVKHLMHSANWYYGKSNYPVLQLVYPDLENHFPEDEDFNPYFAQPMLQTTENMGELESDFWEAMDPESRLGKWAFPDPPNTSAFLSQAVSDGSEPVTYVSHDEEDGAWQFLGNSMSQDKPPILVCLSHPIENDPTLNELATLPTGWWAERTAPGQPWVRREHETASKD